MRPRILFVVLGAFAAVALVRAQNPPRQGQPTFTASTDVVMVDVSVRKDGKQVTGLTAADFELRDNGVKQEVETVESQAVPIDLSILIDVSCNPDRPWVNLPLESKVAGDVIERASKLTRLLRPGDRVRLFALDTYIQQIWPLQVPGQTPAVERVEFDGMPSLYDSLVTLLLQPTEPKRRHVIVAETKGFDAVSVATAADVRQITAQSDAQAHLVMMERKADEEATVRVFQGLKMGLHRATYRFWTPARRRLFELAPLAVGTSIESAGNPGIDSAPLHNLRPDGLALKAGAESTGGGLYQTTGLAEPTLLNTFEKAFENFRQSYVLRYAPKGVARPGWHQITVTMPRDKSVQIKARNGYSIDAPAAPAPAPLPAANTPVRFFADITRAYGDGQFDLVTRSLRQVTDSVRLMTDFVAGGNPWPASPHREAALAIEIAETGVYSPQPVAREQAAALLDRFRFLVRDPIEPDAFEREWLVTVAMMLQGALRPATTQPFIENALTRFRDDPRLLLARAIGTDQYWATSGTTWQGGQLTRTTVPEDQIAALAAQYEVAAAYAPLRAEANMRLGWFLHRMGRDRDALARFDAMGAVDPSDRFLAYLRELLIGQVYSALDRSADATAAFRRALTLVPGAQSARVALMDALLVSGDRDAASALAIELQATPATGIDPWWLYYQGDYRRYPDTLRKLQEMAR